MTRIAYLSFLLVMLAGCVSRPASTGVPQPAQAALGRVRVGMCEIEAWAQMRQVALDWGRVYYGGSGAGRYYFQLSSTQQVWLDVSGPPDMVVTAIGAPEPKTKWTRHTGDSITVE